MKNWKSRFIYFKFCIQRSFGYLAIINGILSPFVYLKIFHWERYFIVLVIVIPILLVIFGLIEDKIGLARTEFELNAERMGLRKC